MSLVLKYRVQAGKGNSTTTINNVFTDILNIMNGSYTNINQTGSYCNQAASSLTGTKPSQYHSFSGVTNSTYNYFQFKKDHSENTTLGKTFTRGFFLEANTSNFVARMGAPNYTNWAIYNNGPNSNGHITSQGGFAQFNWDMGPEIIVVMTPETLHITGHEAAEAGHFTYADYKGTEMDVWAYDNTTPYHCPTIAIHSYMPGGTFNNSSVSSSTEFFSVGTSSCYQRANPTQMQASSGSSNWQYNIGYLNAVNNGFASLSPRPWAPTYIGAAGSDTIGVLRRVSPEDDGWTAFPQFNDCINLYRTSDNIVTVPGTIYTIGSDTYVGLVTHKTGDGSSTTTTSNTRNACYMIKL